MTLGEAHLATPCYTSPNSVTPAITHGFPPLCFFQHARRCKNAEAREREARRRAQEEEHLRQQYESYRAERLAQLRATTPPDALAAVEHAAATHFDHDHTTPCGRDRLRRFAIEDAVAAHFQIPAFAEWEATQGRV
jgi:hypothetical protein